ncbi:MAG: DEAD/DEAH box helicase [Patescibacteria group bacterium]|nr:DEAD/DEAH box helicase [Patescibacteria group bacterium]MDE2015735.1 DEAD/DEAH box helicase [Patescibacteria group bacterium]MDE2226792.1 DEAD/DEAH box helicase [Patescibacteria group bacterium]
MNSDFYNLGIAPNILAVLDKLGFKTPTPIQEKSIPGAIEGKDLIGIAQTGTGKTIAFCVPMLQAVLRGKQGLVVAPTRELALQISGVFHDIGASLGVRAAVLIGGEPIGRQIQALRRGPQIVIGTPGRIIDHLEQKTVSLKSVGVLVLDEADRMLDMGFAPQLKRILAVVPHERQTMLFSATMPQNIVAIAQQYMKLPTRVEIAPSGTTAEKVIQELFFVQKQDKPRLLEKVLGEYRGSVLIFTRMKFGAKRIAAHIRDIGHTAAEIHSNRSLSQRKEALEGFRNGKYRVLVATDIAARGIDVKGIELVLNYDLPTSPEDYVHRIGRTGRIGGAGHAISFATPDQKGDIRDIERLIKATLPLSALPADMPPARTTGPLERTPFHSRFGGPRQGRRSSSFGNRPPRQGYGRRPPQGKRY